jgi:hypothetical protein
VLIVETGVTGATRPDIHVGQADELKPVCLREVAADLFGHELAVSKSPWRTYEGENSIHGRTSLFVTSLGIP